LEITIVNDDAAKVQVGIQAELKGMKILIDIPNYSCRLKRLIHILLNEM